MIKAIIKMLGGYTECEMQKVIKLVESLQKDLTKAQKNDSPKDPKTGKFVTKKKSKQS